MTTQHPLFKAIEAFATIDAQTIRERAAESHISLTTAAKLSARGPDIEALASVLGAMELHQAPVERQRWAGELLVGAYNGEAERALNHAVTLPPGEGQESLGSYAFRLAELACAVETAFATQEV